MRTKEVIYEVGLHTYKLIYNLSKGFAKLYYLQPSIRVRNAGTWSLIEYFENNKREARKLYNGYKKTLQQ